MPISKEVSKKYKSGYSYRVRFSYHDRYGITCYYSKRGFRTKKDALNHEAEKRQELVEYGEITNGGNLTINYLFEEYIQLEKAKYSVSTLKNYMFSYNAYIKNSIGKKPIISCSYKLLQQYFNDCNYSYSTKKNIKKVLAVTFKYAMKNGYIKQTPLQYVNIVKTESDKPMVEGIITREQLDLIINETLNMDRQTPDYDYTQFNNYSFCVALLIGWYCGLRISETLGLEKSDFDFENNMLHLQRRLEYIGIKKSDLHTTEKMKTAKSKANIPFSDELKEILLRWFEKNPYDIVVVDINGNYIHPSTFNARMRTVSEVTNIPFRYHMLRHTFATNLVLNGVNVKIASELVRHTDIRTTINTYTHVGESEMKNAIKRVFGE